MSKYKPSQIACTPPLVAAILSFGVSVLVPEWYWTFIFFLIGVIFILDIGARYREYVILVNKGEPWSGRDIKYFRSSFCRRWAAVKAGMSPEIFRALGYRWYHILPDGFPMCFAKRGFWMNLLGIRNPKRR